MGAIAVSKKEEQQIERLRRELRIPTKSEVIRVALRALETKADEERLRREVHESVRRCASADRKENRELSGAGVARSSRK
ncbi:MAG TPA: hypothetical protein VGW35_15165 [Methylomirabilota bacterium]|jgi:Arc/MetJ-type ribon-helix-helix transcriptional regulator|nr:hypothetical protein [Methylomirabilota bacterium]